MICSRCGSSYRIEEYDPPTHTIVGHHCGMCGRNEFTEEKIMDTEKSDKNYGHCTVDGCPLPAAKKGLCATHYQEEYRKPVRGKKLCAVEGCDRIYWRGGLCYRHYHARLQEQKNPETPRLPSAELNQIVYRMTDGYLREATIVFSFVDGVKTFSNCQYEVRRKNDYSYEDWMFLGAVAQEIKRISDCVS